MVRAPDAINNWWRSGESICWADLPQCRERQGGSVVNNPVTGWRPNRLPVGASVRARCCRALCRRRPIRAAKIHPSSVCVALRALEDAGLLSWVHRLVKVRHRERDLFGHWGSEWQVHRTSNGYTFVDPLDRDPGRRGYKSENPARPQNQEKNQEGARHDGAQVTQEGVSRAPPEQTERLAFALQREQAAVGTGLLSDTERAALTQQLDIHPTKADWDLYESDLEARISNT